MGSLRLSIRCWICNVLSIAMWISITSSASAPFPTALKGESSPTADGSALSCSATIFVTTA